MKCGFFGLFHKELQAEARHRWTLVNRLLLGPLVSVGTVSIIYSGFFRAQTDLRIGQMDADNYPCFVLLGFLAHSVLNSGYYALSNKILLEWIGGTLPILWWAPCSRLKLLFGLTSMEMLRNFIIAILVLIVLSLKYPFSLTQLTHIISGLFLLHWIGIGLGLIRSGLLLVNEGKADWLDHMYMLLIFSGCLYFPAEILPVFVARVCAVNPLFLVLTWLRDPASGLTTALPTLLSLGVLWWSIAVLWSQNRFKILERSLL